MKEVKRKIPAKLSIEFDGWYVADTTYMAMFAAFPAEVVTRYNNVLLALSPTDDKASLGAEQHLAFLHFLLEVLGKDKSNVVALLGDKISTNKVFARD